MKINKTIYRIPDFVEQYIYTGICKRNFMAKAISVNVSKKYTIGITGGVPNNMVALLRSHREYISLQEFINKLQDGVCTIEDGSE